MEYMSVPPTTIAVPVADIQILHSNYVNYVKGREYPIQHVKSNRYKFKARDERGKWHYFESGEEDYLFNFK